MDKKKVYLLLDIISKNSSAGRAIREGLSYYEIAELTQYLIQEGYIEDSENGFILTKKGLESYNQLAVDYKRTNKKEWIEEEKESKIPILEKNDVFLPNQNDLWF